MNKYISRVTSSQRGEPFNPLTYPFFLATLGYGVGFVALISTESVIKSSLFIAMHLLWPTLPLIWGALCILTIVIGFSFLMFNIPPAGKASGLAGFMLWVFASFCWGLTGNVVALVAIGVPNMWFWFWQYLSLSNFRREDAKDIKTLLDYDSGEYDVQSGDNGRGAKRNREDNRGVDRQ